LQREREFAIIILEFFLKNLYQNMNYNSFQEILFFSTYLLIFIFIFSGFFITLHKINLGIDTILISIMLFVLIFALAYSSNLINKDFEVSSQTQKLTEGIISFSQKILLILVSFSSIILCFKLGWFFRQNQSDKDFKQKTLTQKLITFLKKDYYIFLGILLMFFSYNLVFILSSLLQNL
jgi:hypothetical protein